MAPTSNWHVRPNRMPGNVRYPKTHQSCEQTNLLVPKNAQLAHRTMHNPIPSPFSTPANNAAGIKAGHACCQRKVARLPRGPCNAGTRPMIHFLFCFNSICSVQRGAFQAMRMEKTSKATQCNDAVSNCSAHCIPTSARQNPQRQWQYNHDLRDNKMRTDGKV